jgi:hypothetical protein
MNYDEIVSQVAVAGRNAAEVLNFVKGTLDEKEMATAIERPFLRCPYRKPKTADGTLTP